jgi:hypothetical protein
LEQFVFLHADKQLYFRLQFDLQITLTRWNEREETKERNERHKKKKSKLMRNLGYLGYVEPPISLNAQFQAIVRIQVDDLSDLVMRMEQSSKKRAQRSTKKKQKKMENGK